MLKLRTAMRHWRPPGFGPVQAVAEEESLTVSGASTWDLSLTPKGAHERLRLAAAELGKAGHLVHRTKVNREIRQLEAQLEARVAALGWAVLPYLKRDGWRTDAAEVRDALSDIETLRGLLASKRDQVPSPSTVREGCDG